ncbi:MULTISPECIES: hypothetical protein [Sphingobacterium]|uniref:hypothetical protein n=1 Tax=Sphingobacterium TaxID=28453 RepID=UPI0010469910|nr:MULTISPECIES: hypothetical protein [Sphingobacterium]MCW2262226.1 hypothetical protein [Sphingobacterium kitahiroshimense]TCR13026.1 hypothetical protein EDF67_102439 [Sphingobacterium sp. JUb78]
MKTITRIITGIFWVMMLLTTTSAMAQWTHVIAPVNESDISKVTKQSYQNYKGLTAATFEVIGSVEAIKEKGIVKFKLHTQSINMVKYNTYSYRPAPKLKNCINNKLLENETNNYFSANQIGEASFEQAMHSASATFDLEITFIVKDRKYGISGAGNEKGWGYRATRIFKNVKANGVFWADEPIETTFPIEEIKILNNPKLVSFQINDSGIQTAILDFVKKRNQEAEDECKGKTKENEADNKKKDEETQKNKANAKEIEAMKNKLQNQSSMAIESSTKADDFWSGGADKSTSSTGKDNDDFWSGHEEKQENISDKMSTTKKKGSAFVYLCFMDRGRNERHDYLSEIFEIEEGCNDYVLKFYNKILTEYGKGRYDVNFTDPYSHMIEVVKTLNEPYFFDRFTKEIYGKTHLADKKVTMDRLKEMRDKIIAIRNDSANHRTVGGGFIILKEINDFKPCSYK